MKKKILIVLGSGGHTTQMLKLLELLGDRYDYEYVINDNDSVSSKKINGKIYKILNPRLFGNSKFMQMLKSVVGFFQSIKIYWNSKLYAVISAGPGLSFPLFVCAKMLGIKTIFIESWSRVNTQSMAGKLCYKFSDLFFVQWPELKEKYPQAIYAGRLG